MSRRGSPGDCLSRLRVYRAGIASRRYKTAKDGQAAKRIGKHPRDSRSHGGECAGAIASTDPARVGEYAGCAAVETESLSLRVEENGSKTQI